MPGMSGWQVAETLRDGGHRQARILMISASALEAHRTPLAQPFHDGYVIKPIDLGRVLTMVGQLLGLQWTYQVRRRSRSRHRCRRSTSRAQFPTSTS